MRKYRIFTHHPRRNLKFILKICFATLIVLNSCKQESIQLESKNINEVKEDQSYTSQACPNDPTNCYYPNCKTSNSSECQRQELDPCDYTSLWDFAKALACELDKYINGCPFPSNQGYPYPCYEVNFGDCIPLDLNMICSGMESIYSQLNPWRYCFDEDCSEFECPTAQSKKDRHKVITVAYQDEMIACLHNNLKTYLSCVTGSVTWLGRIDIFVCQTTTDCDEELCLGNVRFFAKVNSFWCCPGIGQ